jgi:hypothetical protein
MSPHMDYSWLYDHTLYASNGGDASRMYGGMRSKDYAIDLAKPWHVEWLANQCGLSVKALLAAACSSLISMRPTQDLGAGTPIPESGW